MAIACPFFNLELKQFTQFRLKQRQPVTPQIAAHLMKQLDCCTHGNPFELTLPNVMNMAGFYHCGVLDVLEALHELKRQHFDYRMDGIDGPVIVRDLKGQKRALNHHIHWPTQF